MESRRESHWIPTTAFVTDSILAAVLISRNPLEAHTLLRGIELIAVDGVSAHVSSQFAPDSDRNHPKGEVYHSWLAGWAEEVAIAIEARVILKRFSGAIVQLPGS